MLAQNAATGAGVQYQCAPCRALKSLWKLKSMILDEVEVIGNRMQNCDFKNLKKGYSGLVVTKVAADMTDNEAVQEADRA